MKTDNGKIINRKSISSPFFKTERSTKREPAFNKSGEIYPKTRHCLRGLDGKYGRWDEILRDILNGKLMIVQNWEATDTDTEEDDNYEEDEELPEANRTPKVYDTCKRYGRYAPIRSHPEEDEIQIHTDGVIPGENLETSIRRSNRNSNKI